MSSRVEQILNGETVKPQSRVEELLEGLVVAAGTQPDLSETDPTKPGYVKGRTHYIGINVLDSFEDLVSYTSNYPVGYGAFRTVICQKDNPFMPEGKYIRITLGGVSKMIMTLPPSSGGSRPTYNEHITLDNGVVVKTSLTAYGPDGNADRKGNLWYHVLPTPTEAIVPYIAQPFTVELCEDVLVPLDEKYIPETIQRVGGDVIIPSSTADSTKKFKITVDDTGAITATEVTS